MIVPICPPIPNPKKIRCAAVSFPDRNADYQDGQEALPNMPLFIGFPRSFANHGDLSGATTTRDDVIAATAHDAPTLAIMDTRILCSDPATGRARIISGTLSGKAANAGIVLGPQRHRVEDHGLRWVGAVVKRDGVVEETGLGADVLDDPVIGILWLLHRLARYSQGLSAGDIVLSGNFIRPIEAPPGSRFEADFGPFGQVRISFA